MSSEMYVLQQSHINLIVLKQVNEILTKLHVNQINYILSHALTTKTPGSF
jgi:hypothetical protein